MACGESGSVRCAWGAGSRCGIHPVVDLTGSSGVVVRAMIPAQLFTGNIRPFPGIGDVDYCTSAAMNDVLDDVRKLGLIPVESPGADFEDFWEDAFRASAAVRACENVNADLRLPDEDEVPDPSVRLGPVSTSEEGAHCTDALLMPDALVRFGGRRMARSYVDMSEDFIRGVSDPSRAFEQEGAALAQQVCPDDFYGSLLWLYHMGARKAVVKSSQRKAGVSAVALSPRLDKLRAAVAEDDILCWMSTPDAAPLGGFLVQQWVPMTYEYRFFVVDGKLVSGAGCVEEFTPFNHVGVFPFDPQMRALRGNGIAAHGDTDVEMREDLVQRYTDFATEVVRTLPAHMNTVVFDVALNADTGEPLIVEFNTLPNSGLYASDVYAVYRALVRAGNRGYTGDV